MFLAPYYWGFSFIEVQGPQQEVQGPPVNRKYVQGPQNMWPLFLWPLHPYLFTGLLALAPLLVALAQALAPRKLLLFGRLSGSPGKFGSFVEYCEFCASNLKKCERLLAINWLSSWLLILNSKDYQFRFTRIYGHLRWPFFSPFGYGRELELFRLKNIKIVIIWKEW